MEIKQIVNLLENGGMACNCDLDKWQPMQDTGHTWVCRIYKTAVSIWRMSSDDSMVMGYVNQAIADYQSQGDKYNPVLYVISY